MKVCPKCGQSFNDDNLRFCLLDGEPLVSSQSEPTVVIPPTEKVSYSATQPRKKSKKWLWATLALAVLAVGLAAVVGVALIAYKIGSERGQAVVTNAAASPTPPARISTTSSTEQTMPSPTPPAAASPSASPGDDTNDVEVTPIAWSTTANQFKQDNGQTYTFECPKGGSPIAIWGSDVYTADSSICTAAVHTGKITLEDGGRVTIEMRPGRPVYGSTTRNGITSNTFGEFAHSFVIR
jgi:hypothetical protein